MSSRFSRTIYVGNLPLDIRESEIDDIFYKNWILRIGPVGTGSGSAIPCLAQALSQFQDGQAGPELNQNRYMDHPHQSFGRFWFLNPCPPIISVECVIKFGRIVEIELKIPPRPPAYCFVEYERSREAEDAIRGRDGYNFDGHYLRVELAHGGRGPPSVVDRRGGYGSGGGGRHGASRHSEYRVIVRNLPSSASWQDLKDHMRKAGDVCFVEVYRDGGGTVGVVDYTNYEDMKYAIRKLDDTEFKNPFARSYLRVEAYKGNPDRSRSRSRSRSPRRVRSISSERPVSRSASKHISSRSRSASPRISRSKSRSRSRSKPRSN